MDQRSSGNEADGLLSVMLLQSLMRTRYGNYGEVAERSKALICKDRLACKSASEVRILPLSELSVTLAKIGAWNYRSR
jgi:hypothetical protein